MAAARSSWPTSPPARFDSASGAELLALLKELNAAGHTIILVTHDAHVAAHARRVIELRDGTSSATAHAGWAHPAVEDAAPRNWDGLWSRKRGRQWREALASAWQSLMGNRLRTLLSMLGISIGIAAVVSIMALTTAARGEHRERRRRLPSGRIIFWRGNPNLPPGVPPQPFRPPNWRPLRAARHTRRHLRARNAMTAPRRPRQHGRVLGAEPHSLQMRKFRRRGRAFAPSDFATAAHVVVLDEKAPRQPVQEGREGRGPHRAAFGARLDPSRRRPSPRRSPPPVGGLARHRDRPRRPGHRQHGPVRQWAGPGLHAAHGLQQEAGPAARRRCLQRVDGLPACRRPRCASRWSTACARCMASRTSAPGAARRSSRASSRSLARCRCCLPAGAIALVGGVG